MIVAARHSPRLAPRIGLCLILLCLLGPTLALGCDDGQLDECLDECGVDCAACACCWHAPASDLPMEDGSPCTPSRSAVTGREIEAPPGPPPGEILHVPRS